jgi:hypothetical protein
MREFIWFWALNFKLDMINSVLFFQFRLIIYLIFIRIRLKSNLIIAIIWAFLTWLRLGIAWCFVLNGSSHIVRCLSVKKGINVFIGFDDYLVTIFIFVLDNEIGRYFWKILLHENSHVLVIVESLLLYWEELDDPTVAE